VPLGEDPGAAPRTTTFAVADGVALAGEFRGDPDERLLVFLHGAGQSGSSWTRAAVRLASAGWRTLTLDLRGHGASDRAPGGRYAVDDLRDDVVAVLEAVDEPAAIVGASMGGWLAILVAAALPREAVRGIVLADSAHRGDETGGAGLLEFVRGAADGYASAQDAADALAAVALGGGAPPDPARLRHVLRSADGRLWWHWDPAFAELWGAVDSTSHAERVLAAARTLDCPLLLARGADSRLITDEIATEFCDRVPAARRIDLPGVGHMFSGDDNAVFVEAIGPFLTAITSDAVS
jgi:pimeloyl-ACP methyl ester carboxylesterase